MNANNLIMLKCNTLYRNKEVDAEGEENELQWTQEEKDQEFTIPIVKLQKPQEIPTEATIDGNSDEELENCKEENKEFKFEAEEDNHPKTWEA